MAVPLRLFREAERLQTHREGNGAHEAAHTSDDARVGSRNTREGRPCCDVGRRQRNRVVRRHQPRDQPHTNKTSLKACTTTTTTTTTTATTTTTTTTTTPFIRRIERGHVSAACTTLPPACGWQAVGISRYRLPDPIDAISRAGRPGATSTTAGRCCSGCKSSCSRLPQCHTACTCRDRWLRS